MMSGGILGRLWLRNSARQDRSQSPPLRMAEISSARVLHGLATATHPSSAPKCSLAPQIILELVEKRQQGNVTGMVAGLVHRVLAIRSKLIRYRRLPAAECSGIKAGRRKQGPESADAQVSYLVQHVDGLYRPRGSNYTTCDTSFSRGEDLKCDGQTGRRS